MFALRSAANTTSDIADLRSAGFPATAPGAHGTEFAMVFPSVGTVPEAKQFVASRHAEGSDYLKLILNGVRSATAGVQNLDEPRVKALVDAAHAAGMLAVAHVETLDDVEIALSAGIDGLMHVWRRGGANPEMARRLRERNVFVVPALAVPDGFLPEGRASLLAEPRFASVISKSIRDHLSQSFLPKTMPIDSARGNLADQMAAVRSLHAAGVKLLVGTDASPGNPTAQGISVHREIELLKEAGLRPSEILTAATSDTAEAFHLLDRGRILPGRRADLVLIRGNPTSDLSSVRDIARVWKAGVEMDRSAAVR